MKILQVTNFFKPSWEAGGPPRAVYEISRKLVERGHEVTVYTTDGFKYRLNVEKNKPVDVEGIKVYYFRNLSNYLSKKWVLPTPYYLPIVARKEMKFFDIIHVHEYRTALTVITCYYAKKYSIPYILQARGSILPFFTKKKIKRFFDRIWGYKILRDVSKAFALTRIEAEQYKKMGIKEDKIEIVPNGIDLAEYENLPEKGRFRRKYGIRDDEKIILYLGRIHKIKGLDLLVSAFADLIKEIDNVKLVMVGPDDGFLSILKSQIEKLGVSDKVLLTGPLYDGDKLEAYIDADIYVLPSRYETFPNTVLEALACGTPVIITNRCGIADIVRKVGYVVRYDKNQLKKKILRFLTNPQLRNAYSKKGKMLVKEKYDWSRIVERIEKIYYECIQEMKE
jgi:glycosyltransferase involved in cell wall biosynthesis